MPGETIVTEMWDEGGGKITVRATTKPNDTVVISNAQVTLA
jgi:hypothetical protein